MKNFNFYKFFTYYIKKIMENNDQSNYEIGVLREEIISINGSLNKFRKENLDTQQIPSFDPKDPKH